jgi:hypothetical protein
MSLDPSLRASPATSPSCRSSCALDNSKPGFDRVAAGLSHRDALFSRCLHRLAGDRPGRVGRRWPNAASRRLGLSRNWTPVYFEDEPGRTISSSTANAQGAIGRLDFHFTPQQQRQERCYSVFSAGGEPECAARGLNNRAARPFVWIIHKLVEPNL